MTKRNIKYILIQIIIRKYITHTHMKIELFDIFDRDIHFDLVNPIIDSR